MRIPPVPMFFSATLWKGLASVLLCVLSFDGYAGPFAVCPENTLESPRYALCASAQCWTIDEVAYCKCKSLIGRSISTPYNYREDGQKKNVCNLLSEGPVNGFTVSTYSTPRQIMKSYVEAVEKQGAPQALYTCDPTTDNRYLGAYSAQCDGGLCFLGTAGKAFPGLGTLEKDQLICACPPKANQTPFQIVGPWNCAPGDANVKGRCCDRAFFKRYCGIHNIKRTGTIIPVGAPVGVGRGLSKRLDGSRVQINECFGGQ